MNILDQNPYILILFVGLVWLVGAVCAVKRNDNRLLLRLSTAVCFVGFIAQFKIIKSNFQLLIIFVAAYCVLWLLQQAINVVRSKRKADKAEVRNPLK